MIYILYSLQNLTQAKCAEYGHESLRMQQVAMPNRKYYVINV